MAGDDDDAAAASSLLAPLAGSGAETTVATLRGYISLVDAYRHNGEAAAVMLARARVVAL